MRIRHVWLALALSLSACGGSSPEVETAPVELPPADPRAVREFAAGVRLMQRGGRRNTQRARAKFERALQIDRYLWEAHYNLGVLDRRAGEMRSAIQHFEEARRVQPGATEPLLALAEARYAMAQRDEASELLSAYVESHPDAVDARVALTTMLRERGEHDDALEQAREALIRDPSNVRALIEIGRIYRAREQYDVANLVFRKALDLSPDNAAIHNDLGLVALARGDTQAAFVELARAIEIDARYAPARMNQGSVLLHAGDYEGAAREYRAVLQLDEEDLDARVALAAALRGGGEHGQAKRELDRVLQAAPNHPAALFNLAVLRAEFLDQRPQSRELFQRFLEVAPSDAPQREMAERYLREIPAPGGGGGG